MKLLITGGAGFIGTNFLYYQIEKHPDREIVCLDALTYAGNINNVRSLIDDGRIEFVKGDITDRNQVFDLFSENKFDAVVHFAAESHVDKSIEDPGIFLQTNIIGTQILLDASRKFKVERYHQVSTDEVYGDLPLDRPDLLFTEQSHIRPSSPYSASKASADLLVQAYHRTYGAPTTISRCSNNYGPFQFPEKLIPRMILLALQNLRLPVYGDGKNIRDWLHVRDHCSAIDLILTEGRIGDVYNIGGNCEKRNIDVVKIILERLNRKQELIEFVKDRPGHDLRYAIDSSKLFSELNWQPSYTFEDGIEETISWYLNNRNWLDNVSDQGYVRDNQRVI